MLIMLAKSIQSTDECPDAFSCGRRNLVTRTNFKMAAMWILKDATKSSLDQ